MSETFKAVLLNKNDEGLSVEYGQMSDDDLMEGDVTLRVLTSTINYKDALAITGKAPVVRRWPMVPGIDCVGEVISSSHTKWKEGDRVILNGWGTGETHLGAYAEKTRINGDWLVHLPEGLDSEQAMAIGTAGYTAMLCVMALEEQGVTPDQGPIIVTGATGGVGSVAVSLLSSLGFEVHASTGRVEEESYLKQLGAAQIVDRNQLSEPGRPLDKEIWAGAVDAVGSQTLANVLAQTQYGGTVTACGLAQGFDLPTTVMPFILRNVKLVGIDSVMAPIELREKAWGRLATDLDKSKLAALTTKIDFDDVVEKAKALINEGQKGRLVVRIGS